jgi:hypothetical protein
MRDRSNKRDSRTRCRGRTGRPIGALARGILGSLIGPRRAMPGPAGQVDKPLASTSLTRILSHDISGTHAALPQRKENSMPTVTSPNLTLSESNGIVTMTITFLPTFSNFEKNSVPSDAHMTRTTACTGLTTDFLVRS